MAAVSIATPVHGPPGLKGDASISMMSRAVPMLVKVAVELRNTESVSVSAMDLETVMESVQPPPTSADAVPVHEEDTVPGVHRYADQKEWTLMYGVA